jgi:CHASE2 domain-containing sensor protein
MSNNRGKGDFFIRPSFQLWLFLPSMIAIALMFIVFVGSLSLVRYAAFDYLQANNISQVLQSNFIMETNRILAAVVIFVFIMLLALFLWMNIIGRSIIGPVARLEAQLIKELQQGNGRTPLKVRNRDYLSNLVALLEQAFLEKETAIEQLRKNAAK